MCNENPLKACSTNIIGTKNLLESISGLKKNHGFYASTSHVYKEKKPLSETDDISPKTLYGYTKWMGEKLTANYCLIIIYLIVLVEFLVFIAILNQMIIYFPQ